MFYYIIYPIFYLIFWTIAKGFGRLRVSGRDNVPKTGAFLYCPNHLSDSDPPTVFVSLPRPAWFVGKSELFEEGKVLSWIIRNLHAIPIKRDSPDRGALRKIEEKLKLGKPVVIFPEGRCAQDGKLQKIQPGAAMIALRTNVPIVPVGVMHTNELMPYGDTKPRRAKHPVTVEFGKPIYPSDFAHLMKGEAMEAITRKLTEELARLTGQELPAQAQPGGVAENGAHKPEKSDAVRMIKEHNAVYAAIRKDKKAWTAELSERKLWEATLTDGLTDEQ